ncbi:tetratricopeptide repeat protein [Actinophytocola algeriensis]|uniref:Cytochrome c-type biogenesis protein CcmH/NrfG n=1 Tax=Actinophytocola algeriensis TaxID=1768010 RepID=A0A7W7Q885_9PSEU|nr:tetratricopeptide repeat protein [Actinophytocola algeriensis]MBB4908882.1 cytochrome c-type biogenesis protein CcmH/NrfG [Actinophytocola algeriensis]MBE1474730.1 cytochrome c-type biogenesis protein CcmH/NrfG [Actinophytocola algeriensis]
MYSAAMSLLVDGSYFLARALYDQGRKAEAEVAFRDAIRIEPTLSEAFCHLANMLAEQGRYAEAEPLLREAIRLDPDWELPHSILADLLKARHRGTS